MKEVLFLRHAKSDWNVSYGGDHERPLNQRGRAAADAVGRFIGRAELVPDLVLASTAVRARTTAERAAKAGDWSDVSRQLSESFYGAGPETLVAACRSLQQEVGRVLLVGHEPGWSQTVGLLIGRADIRMATATLACVAFDIDSWDQVAPGVGQLRWLIPPRLLESWPTTG